MASTIGGKSVEKLELDCIIKKIECVYRSLSDEQKVAVLYDRSNFMKDKVYETDYDFSSNTIKKDDSAYDELKTQVSSSVPLNVMLCGSLVYNENNRYRYFITDNVGKDIMIDCDRKENECKNDEHNKYTIETIDINSHELDIVCLPVTNGKLKLQYFELWNESLVDLWTLRFIYLPIIRDNDKNYHCHTSLIYNQCKQVLPTIYIYIYPNIEYSLKIGFLGVKKNWGKNDFKFDLKVEYANIEKTISYENINEEKLDSETKDGYLLYKVIKALADFLQKTAQFAESLAENMDTVYGEDNNISKDVSDVGKKIDKIGKKIGKVGKTLPDWLSSNIEINPFLECAWRYSVNENLSRLGKYIECKFGVECKGALTIDLIKAAVVLLPKIKKAANVVTAGVVIGSGGVATIPAVFVQYLIGTVVDWLIEKYVSKKEDEMPIYFNLIIEASAVPECPIVRIDTSQKNKINNDVFSKSELKLTIKFDLGFKIKTSEKLVISLGVSGGVSAETEIKWDMMIDKVNDYFGLSHTVSIKPLTIRINIECVGSFNRKFYDDNKDTKEKKKSELKSKIENVFEIKEITSDTYRINLFKIDERDDKGI